MIQDVTPKDVQTLISRFIDWMYKKSIDHFEDLIWSIAQRNQQAKQSTVFTFTFGGKIYRFENAIIRYPQSLAKELVPEMHEIVRQRKKIVDEEGAYVRQAMVAACSRCESASQLYSLLPEVVHPFLDRMGIPKDLHPDFSPLSEKVVMEFRTSQAVNIAKIKQRVTRNTLGIIK